MRVVVLGLGKIGLPLAVQYASRGHHVYGVDVREDTVEQVNVGAAPFPGEQDLDERLRAAVTSGRLQATTDYAKAVPGADVIVVVVPLVVNDVDQPDFSLLDGATASLAAHLTPDALVVYETTLPVGVTRNRWKPALETSGLVEGVDFHLAFSPERVLTGRVFADLSKYPKVIGCFTDEGRRRTRAFYESVLTFDPRPDLTRPNGVWDLGTPEAAELTKLAETTYRDVNIALANQFATFAQSAGIDVHAVIEAANSQPYSHIHRPGISVGGHCIPVYPRLYLTNDPDASIVRAAREVNEDMPRRAAQLLANLHGDLGGARVAVLGASYRAGVKEVAFSGVFALAESLSALGATVTVHDPMHSSEEIAQLGLVPHRLGDTADAVILHTDHASYAGIGPADLPGVTTIVDGRGVLEPESFPGATVATLGRPLPRQKDRP